MSFEQLLESVAPVKLAMYKQLHDVAEPIILRYLAKKAKGEDRDQVDHHKNAE